ncbi:MAG: amidohydrolase family protein, partial [Ilumatobacteraceae bacterium]
MTVDRYWCEYAWLGGAEVASGVTIEVAGDRIAAVTDGADEPPDGSTKLSGLTLPALANAHSHAFHRALRGRTHGDRGSFWTWRDLMYSVAGRLDPESYGALARAVFAEMAQAGVGVLGEFHYVHHRPDGSPHDDPNAVGLALVDAARDVGIRLTLLDTLYLYGGFDATGHRPLQPEQLRFGDRGPEAWVERVDALHTDTADPLVVVGAAIHSVRAVDPTGIEAAAAWSDRHA